MVLLILIPVFPAQHKTLGPVTGPEGFQFSAVRVSGVGQDFLANAEAWKFFFR